MSLENKIFQKGLVWRKNLRRVNEDDNTIFNLKDIIQTLVLQRPVFLHKKLTVSTYVLCSTKSLR